MTDTPDVLSLVFRVVSFVLALNAAGLPIFVAVFGRHLSPGSLAATARLGWRMAAAALIVVIAHHLLEAARMAGEISGVADPALQAMALHSQEGSAFVSRVTGLVVIAGGLHWLERSRVVSSEVWSAANVAVLGMALTILSFAQTGHTWVATYHLVSATLLVLHLVVVSFWMGALWPLYSVSRDEPSAVAGRLIDAFSRLAAWLVPIILLAGVGLAVFLVPSLATFKQPYGQLLLAKVVGFALLMGLAALNKWRYGPACAAGETRAFRQTVIVEYVLICLVLAVTATMTTFYSPEAP
jgi:putative copper export protein